MHNATFLKEIRAAFGNIEQLTNMPNLADWERDTRMRAIYAHLSRRMDEWWKLHHEAESAKPERRCCAIAVYDRLPRMRGAHLLAL